MSKESETYRVHCRLKEFMTAQNITVDQLHQMSRVNRDTISQMRNDNFLAVSTQTMARLCGALGIGIGELFELLPEDIWLPIRLSREVTLHLGARTFAEQPPERDAGDGAFGRRFLGLWDFRAFECISEYLLGLKRDIRVHFKAHTTGSGGSVDPTVGVSAQRVFERGHHVVIGSPLASQFTEEVVCRVYGVPPYSPEERGRFPYGFEWDLWRKVQSSIGWQGHRKEFGIAALPSNQIVAPHVIVPSGEGTDGALILVYRVFQAPDQREGTDDDERIIICLLGYSGPGTLAAAQLATNPEFAAGLYPPARMVPRMRAVACKYVREANESHEDNRELTDVTLIPEHAQPDIVPPGRGGSPRRGG